MIRFPFSVTLGLLLFSALAGCSHLPWRPSPIGFTPRNCKAPTSSVSAELPVILIDPGHTSKQGGAMSVTGQSEVTYNDRFAAVFAEVLSQKEPCLTVALTRQPHEEISLEERVSRINSVEGAWVIAIHHDSAQEQDLERIGEKNGEGIWRTRRPLEGYSLFIAPSNLQYKASLRLARKIGRALLKTARKPTYYHSLAIPGEKKEIVDFGLGIFHHPEIAVIKNSRHPAVLIELGFLPDPVDENTVRSEEFIRKTATSLSHSISTLLPSTTEQ